MIPKYFWCLVFVCFLSPFSANAQSCFPTCEEEDAKLVPLVPAEFDPSSLSGEPFRVTFISASAQLEFGVFDSDLGGLWDNLLSPTASSATSSRVSYAVYADRNKTGQSAGSPVVEFFSNDTAGAVNADDPGAVDNAWRDIVIDHPDSAFDGNTYNYVFEAKFLDPVPAPNDAAGGAFKLRVNGDLFLSPNNSLPLAGRISGAPQFPTVFNDILPTIFPDLVPACNVLSPGDSDISGCGTPGEDENNCCACLFEDGDFNDCYDNTTYDGGFVIPVLIEAEPGEIVNELTIWDGDLDFGDGPDCPAPPDPDNNPQGFCGPGPDDTDDPDTLPAARPTFGVSGFAVDEGAKLTGDPPEDNISGTVFPFFAVDEAITYELVSPDGERYENTNPSSDQEWERFTIRLNDHPDGCDNTVADFCVDAIPDGVWEIRVIGMDLQNLNFFGVEFTSMRRPVDSIAIPTLTEWGIMLMTFLFGIFTFLTLRRRRV